MSPIRRRVRNCARLEKVDAFNLHCKVWRCEMERVPRQRYTKEFRDQAVQLVLQQKLTIPEAARRLTLSGKLPSDFGPHYGPAGGVP